MTTSTLPRRILADDDTPTNDVWHDHCRACHTLDNSGERFCSDCSWD